MAQRTFESNPTRSLRSEHASDVDDARDSMKSLSNAATIEGEETANNATVFNKSFLKAGLRANKLVNELLNDSALSSLLE